MGGAALQDDLMLSLSFDEGKGDLVRDDSAQTVNRLLPAGLTRRV